MAPVLREELPDDERVEIALELLLLLRDTLPEVLLLELLLLRTPLLVVVLRSVERLLLVLRV